MEFIQTSQDFKLFFYGFGSALGVAMLFVGIVGWFISRKIDKYDNYLKRIENLENFAERVKTAHFINHKQDIT